MSKETQTPEQVAAAAAQLQAERNAKRQIDVKRRPLYGDGMIKGKSFGIMDVLHIAPAVGNAKAVTTQIRRSA
jgi:hypothetical protein